MGSVPAGYLTFLQPSYHFAWHWARQCTDTRRHIAALSIMFLSFLDFVSGDLALTAVTGFNSEQPTSSSTVLEHLESGQGQGGLRPLTRPPVWA